MSLFSSLPPNENRTPGHRLDTSIDSDVHVDDDDGVDNGIGQSFSLLVRRNIDLGRCRRRRRLRRHRRRRRRRRHFQLSLQGWRQSAQLSWLVLESKRDGTGYRTERAMARMHAMPKSQPESNTLKSSLTKSVQKSSSQNCRK